MAEDLNFRIVGIVNSAGASIAIAAAIEHPRQSCQFESDLQNKIENQISKNLESEVVAVELSEQEIYKIKNTLPYPN